MRFSDEKQMWHADTERLVKQMANKSEQELLDIFDKHDIIKIVSTDRPEVATFNRLMFVLLFIPLTVLAATKWMVSGDRYLDSWAKKYKLVGWIYKLIGVDKRR